MGRYIFLEFSRTIY